MSKLYYDQNNVKASKVLCIMKSNGPLTQSGIIGLINLMHQQHFRIVCLILQYTVDVLIYNSLVVFS